MSEEEELLTAIQAAEYLGCTVHAVYDYRQRGMLEAVIRHNENGTKPRYYFPTSSLDALLLTKHTQPIAQEKGIEVQQISQKLPACHHCRRRFLERCEYDLAEFTDTDGEPIWRPVCRGGCGAPDYKGQNEQLIDLIRFLGSQISEIIEAYDSDTLHLLRSRIRQKDDQ